MTARNPIYGHNVVRTLMKDSLTRKAGLRESLVRGVIVLTPVTFVLQPLIVALLPQAMGDLLKPLLLWGFGVLLPLWILLTLPRSVHIPSVGALLALVLVTSYHELINNFKDFALVFLALVTSVPFYRAGVLTALRRGDGERWGMLVHSTSVINLTTLALMAAASTGRIDMITLLNQLSKEVMFGLNRFSLGNPIEVPLLVCSFLYAGLRHAPTGRVYLVAATLNLITTAISESRVLLIVAIFIFAQQWWRSPNWLRITCLIAAAMILRASWHLVEPVLVSIGERYSGNDRGSTYDRAWIASMILDQITPLSLIFGNGLNSASEFMLSVRGQYRTVESVLLQLQYEIGVLGLLFIVSAMHINLGIIKEKVSSLKVTTIIIWIQIFFFIPVNAMMPMISFALGALLVQSSNIRTKSESNLLKHFY